jgi:predicted GH43/DUF377 family glycosyl hydrolase
VWKKSGLIHQAPGDVWWARSHAMVPTPLEIGDDRLRIYFASTDENSVGRIGFVEVAISNPTKILKCSDNPVFDIGEPGSFDDSGVVPSSILRLDGQIWLYYIGFQRFPHQTPAPYTMFTGLAISKDGGLTFQRKSTEPILGPIKDETITRTAPFVVKTKECWRLWYVGGNSFIEVDNKLRPTYSIRYLESNDGLHWPGTSKDVLVPRGDGEYGFGRPRILFDQGSITMFYSVRSKTEGYQMGVASSPDGLEWRRYDELLDLKPGPEDWDSQTIEYGAFFEHGDNLLMFYNGNQNGRTGFGLAVSNKSDWQKLELGKRR